MGEVNNCEIMQGELNKLAADLRLQAILLVSITVISYLPALRCGYIWDDDRYVTANSLLYEPDGLYRIWFSKDSPSQYFPMAYTTFRLEYKLWGLNPAGYHTINILLHSINVLLLFLLLRYLYIPGAWLAAAIFALHPVQVESVAWISERKNLLMAFFFFLSLLAWAGFVYRTCDSKRAWPLYILSLLLYILALLSKTTACTLPIALVLILWLRNVSIDTKRWIQIAPYILLGLAMGMFTMWWEKWHQGTGEVELGISLLKRILIASQAVWFYIGKLVIPLKLTFSYPRWNIDVTKPLQYSWLIMCAIVSAGMWFWRGKIGRGPIAAVIFFVVTLSPILGFISLFTFLYSYVADHYQYIACIGPITLFAAFVYHITAKFKGNAKNVIVSFIGLILFILGILTWQQCYIYKNEETLWRDTIIKNPDSPMANNNVGSALAAQNKLDEALIYFNRALEHDMDKHLTSITYCNLGCIYKDKGNVEKAIYYFRQALKENPDDSFTHYQLAGTLALQGGLDDAIQHYAKALEISPDIVPAHIEIAPLLVRQGRFDDAKKHYRQALQFDPDNAELHCSLGRVLEQQSNLKEAVEEYKKALEIDPEFTKAKEFLQSALARQIKQ